MCWSSLDDRVDPSLCSRLVRQRSPIHLRSIVLALLVTACAGAPAARSSPPRAGDPALASRLERARAEVDLPGAAALIIEDGEVTARAVIGYRSLPSHTPLTLDDRFHLGSDGKAMTATLARRAS
jgi:CubicO group peptidase (beta-lactamase class C family)